MRRPSAWSQWNPRSWPTSAEATRARRARCISRKGAAATGRDDASVDRDTPSDLPPVETLDAIPDEVVDGVPISRRDRAGPGGTRRSARPPQSSSSQHLRSRSPSTGRTFPAPSYSSAASDDCDLRLARAPRKWRGIRPLRRTREKRSRHLTWPLADPDDAVRKWSRLLRRGGRRTANKRGGGP
ncbi:MAG: hypothetical protein JWM72_3301 [Actinomycetia bacterium]|nr:hypothetical protein [Actinomycetes bacterium]